MNFAKIGIFNMCDFLDKMWIFAPAWLFQIKITWGSDSCATTVECMCILLLRCPPTARFGLWVVWVAACKVAVAADPAKRFNQSRGPIVMVWAMDFVNTWRRTESEGRWDVTLVWSAPRWCRQGQQFWKIEIEILELTLLINRYPKPSCESRIVSRWETHMLG